jgi:hypothetical protein
MTIFSNPLSLESLMRKASEPESWERVPLESGGFASGGNFDQPAPIPLGRAGSSLSGASVIPVIYGGPNAETADQNERQRALKLRAQGHDWNEIWNSTGWGPTVEGKWAFDISDHDATLNARGDTVGEILNHPRLFEAYPHLRNMRVEFRGDDDMTGLFGYYLSPEPGSAERIVIRADLSPRERLETLLHELQHAIQFREGFAQGGSSKALAKIIEKQGGIGPEKTTDPNRAYELLAGEEQAESVVKRREMTPERRREVPPWDRESENVPRDRQIIMRWKGNRPVLQNQADDDSNLPIPPAHPPLIFR